MVGVRLSEFPDEGRTGCLLARSGLVFGGEGGIDVALALLMVSWLSEVLGVCACHGVQRESVLEEVDAALRS